MTRFLAGLAAALVLAGCGSSDPAAVGALDGAAPRAGVSTDHLEVTSDVDGAVIAFTVHEPRQVVEGARYPLVLHSHGYGGSRVNAAGRPAEGGTGSFARLLDAGYGVVSIDERGFRRVGRQGAHPRSLLRGPGPAEGHRLG